MQTIQFLKTAEWIKAQFSEKTINLIFEGGLFTFNIPRDEDEKERDRKSILSIIIECSHEIAVVQPRLVTHPFASTILKEFGLDDLLEEGFSVHLALLIVREEKEVKEKLHHLIMNIVSSWKIFNNCIGPVGRITTPAVIAEQKDFDEVLTIELRYGADANPTIKVMCDTLKHIQNLYNDVCHLVDKKDVEPLVSIYAASGSSFRFDFSGSGEIIREIKKTAYRYLGAGSL